LADLGELRGHMMRNVVSSNGISNMVVTCHTVDAIENE
jgi:hypothetical protein